MLAVTVMICAVVLLHSDSGMAKLGELPGSPAAIAQLLFHDLLLPFEVTSVLVLIAIMGAVVLAARPESAPTAKEGTR
jgi:NADH-quinone oxidoreductase subunit J